jgi:uncharacterized protein YjbI with pentapeptide repeats
MTLRNWLELFIVPFALVVVGFLFTMQQDARQQKIETQRAEAERKLVEQRAQDEALQAYLNQMGNLLLEKDLRESEEDSEVRTLARARTLTVLGRLDSSHKTAVMQFLVEAELIQRVDGRGPLIRLVGADLRGTGVGMSHDPFSVGGGKLIGRKVRTNVSGADLSLANLSNADLNRVNLSGADLTFANLSNADLSDAELSGVDLSLANLSNADLNSVNLSGADLEAVNLSGADLNRVNLSGADLNLANLSTANLNRANLIAANLRTANLRSASLRDANLHEADLSSPAIELVGAGTDLREADLRNADLRGADLRGANLRDADLHEADLLKADLRYVTGVSEEQLEEQAEILEDATMPDGSKHP